jgi:hypothetical protein
MNLKINPVGKNKHQKVGKKMDRRVWKKIKSQRKTITERGGISDGDNKESQ